MKENNYYSIEENYKNREDNEIIKKNDSRTFAGIDQDLERYMSPFKYSSNLILNKVNNRDIRPLQGNYRGKNNERFQHENPVVRSISPFHYLYQSRNVPNQINYYNKNYSSNKANGEQCYNVQAEQENNNNLNLNNSNKYYYPEDPPNSPNYKKLNKLNTAREIKSYNYKQNDNTTSIRKNRMECFPNLNQSFSNRNYNNNYFNNEYNNNNNYNNQNNIRTLRRCDSDFAKYNNFQNQKIYKNNFTNSDEHPECFGYNLLDNRFRHYCPYRNDYNPSRYGDNYYNYFLKEPMKSDKNVDWRFPPLYYYHPKYDDRNQMFYNL